MAAIKVTIAATAVLSAGVVPVLGLGDALRTELLAAPTALDWLSVVGKAADAVARWVSEGYQRHPMLIIGLGGLFLLPPLAVIGWLLLGGRTARTVPAHDAAFGCTQLTRDAWIEIEGDTDCPRALDRELIRIGREPDNEICLLDATVHRYHAIIERSRDLGYFITDVSGPQGNGLLVNGRRRHKAGLSDGDIVELGRAKMRFAVPA